jgi:hypothetical protein
MIKTQTKNKKKINFISKIPICYKFSIEWAGCKMCNFREQCNPKKD